MGIFSICIALFPMLVLGMAVYTKVGPLLVADQKEIAEQAVVRAEDKIAKTLEKAKSIVSMLAENIRLSGGTRALGSFPWLLKNIRIFQVSISVLKIPGK